MSGTQGEMFQAKGEALLSLGRLICHKPKTKVNVLRESSSFGYVELSHTHTKEIHKTLQCRSHKNE